MKKILICILSLIFVVSGCSCKNGNEEILEIPAKYDLDGTSVFSSSVTTKNLDEYMFRDDVQYVDLRNPEMILQEGYIAGFEFISFHSIIASFTSEKTLYKMAYVTDKDGNTIPPGQVGGFVPQYEQSKNIITSLFEKDKYIFLISQGGSESSYVINLLVQLGYDASLLYNVGGVMNSEGLPSYSSIESNKYFVEGHGDLDVLINYDFMKDLTPIKSQ